MDFIAKVLEPIQVLKCEKDKFQRIKESVHSLVKRSEHHVLGAHEVLRDTQAVIGAINTIVDVVGNKYGAIQGIYDATRERPGHISQDPILAKAVNQYYGHGEPDGAVSMADCGLSQESLIPGGVEIKRRVEFTMDDECDDCKKKPGSPALCAECIEKRDLFVRFGNGEWVDFEKSLLGAIDDTGEIFYSIVYDNVQSNEKWHASPNPLGDESYLVFISNSHPWHTVSSNKVEGIRLYGEGGKRGGEAPQTPLDAELSRYVTVGEVERMICEASGRSKDALRIVRSAEHGYLEKKISDVKEYTEKEIGRLETWASDKDMFCDGLKSRIESLENKVGAFGFLGPLEPNNDCENRHVAAMSEIKILEEKFGTIDGQLVKALELIGPVVENVHDILNNKDTIIPYATKSARKTNRDLRRLDEKVDGVSARMDGFFVRCREAIERIGGIEKQVAENAKSIGDTDGLMEVQNGELHLRVDKLNERLAVIEKALSEPDYNKTVDRSELNAEGLMNEIEMAQGAVDSIKDRIDKDIDYRIDTLSSAFDILKRKVEFLEDANKDNNGFKDHTSARLSDLNMKVGQVNAELGNKLEGLDATMRALDEVPELIETMARIVIYMAYCGSAPLIGPDSFKIDMAGKNTKQALELVSDGIGRDYLSILGGVSDV